MDFEGGPGLPDVFDFERKEEDEKEEEEKEEEEKNEEERKTDVARFCALITLENKAIPCWGGARLHLVEPRGQPFQLVFNGLPLVFKWIIREAKPDLKTVCS